VRNKLTIAILILLTIILSIYVKESKSTKNKYTEYPVNVMDTVNNHKQFSKKYSVIGDTHGISVQVALTQSLETKEIEFLLIINYVREDEQYFPPKFLYDGNNLIKYVGSLKGDRQHLFQMKMYQWFYYMEHGFNGYMYIEETDEKLAVQLPPYFFKEIDQEFISWKDE